MRQVRSPQLRLGEIPVDKIELDPKSRDDIPALLKGLQLLWLDEDRRARVFELLETQIRPGTDRTVGRPGMQLWTVLVPGVVKQGPGCDFDRLQELANEHRTLRALPGHGAFNEDRYACQNIVDNVSLLTPALLHEVNRLVVETGHAVARKKPGAPLRGRCDSFVVETDVHWPTDVNLLWDGLRCLIRETQRACKRHGIAGLASASSPDPQGQASV